MSNTHDILSEIHSRLAPQCVRVEKMPNGLAFMLPLHSESPGPMIFGTATLDTYSPAPDTPIQLLSVEFILFQDLPTPSPEKTPFRLHELNIQALFGTLSINTNRQLCYRHTCTVNDYDSTQAAQLFELVSYEMLLFLSFYYDYIFICATDPERLTVDEYLQLVLSASDSDLRQSEKGGNTHA